MERIRLAFVQIIQQKSLAYKQLPRVLFGLAHADVGKARLAGAAALRPRGEVQALCSSNSA
eukprot:2921288-Alexandrium_andersonii.AAC.1